MFKITKCISTCGNEAYHHFAMGRDKLTSEDFCFDYNYKSKSSSASGSIITKSEDGINYEGTYNDEHANGRVKFVRYDDVMGVMMSGKWDGNGWEGNWFVELQNVQEKQGNKSLSSHGLAEVLLKSPNMPVATHAMGHTYISGADEISHGPLKVGVLSTHVGDHIIIGDISRRNINKPNWFVKEMICGEAPEE